jgi:hypothetical protein
MGVLLQVNFQTYYFFFHSIIKGAKTERMVEEKEPCFTEKLVG